MIVALTFTTPLLLIGVAAAAIPFALHLLSSVRAREVPFPTLRFLQISMEKTARRRRVQHWLLMLLRAALLALLALAVAEPISQLTAAAPEPEDTKYAAVLVIDNSLSMSALNRGSVAEDEAVSSSSRLDKAIADARAMLQGEHRPDAAAFLLTNRPARTGEPAQAAAESPRAPELSSDLDNLLRSLDEVDRTDVTEADLAAAVRLGIDILAASRDYDERAIYVFSDLQRTNLADLDKLEGLARARQMRLVFVSSVAEKVRNLSVAKVEVTGRPIIGEPLTIHATVTNSSPTEDMQGTVRLMVNDRAIADKEVYLSAAGRDRGREVVEFRHIPRTAGPLSGQVVLAGADDLAQDNERHFALDVSDRARALVVHGPAARSDPAGFGPDGPLLVALQPFGPEDGPPWPIRVLPPDGVPAADFKPSHLAGMSAAFFSDVPAFDAGQAASITEFVRDGGTAVFFLGGNVRPEDYNAAFFDASDPAGSLFPGEVQPAIGDLDLTAEAAAALPDTEHRLFAHPDLDAPPPTIIRRHFPIKLAATASADVPMRTPEGAADAPGDPLVIWRRFGQGRVGICATSTSPVWNNCFGAAGVVFMPMVYRMCLPEPRPLGRDHPPLREVTIRPALRDWPDDASVIVETPAGEPVEAGTGPDARTFVLDSPRQFGTYQWSVPRAADGQAGAFGAFVVNPEPEECDLEPIEPRELTAGLTRRGLEAVHVGTELPDVDTLAAIPAEPPQPRRWWDDIMVAVILLLVFEAVVANHFRRRDESAPAN